MPNVSPDDMGIEWMDKSTPACKKRKFLIGGCALLVEMAWTWLLIEGDFHPQAVAHARRTKKSPLVAG